MGSFPEVTLKQQVGENRLGFVLVLQVHHVARSLLFRTVRRRWGGGGDDDGEAFALNI